MLDFGNARHAVYVCVSVCIWVCLTFMECTVQSYRIVVILRKTKELMYWKYSFDGNTIIIMVHKIRRERECVTMNVAFKWIQLELAIYVVAWVYESKMTKSNLFKTKSLHRKYNCNGLKETHTHSKGCQLVRLHIYISKNRNRLNVLSCHFLSKFISKITVLQM